MSADEDFERLDHMEDTGRKGFEEISKDVHSIALKEFETVWHGTRTNHILGLAYVLKNAPYSTCAVFNKIKCTGHCFLRWDADKQELEYTDEFIDNLRGCLTRDKRFVIIPITLVRKKRKSKTGKTRGRHSNYVIIDTNADKYEKQLSKYFKYIGMLYEPHGYSKSYSTKNLGASLHRMFKLAGIDVYIDYTIDNNNCPIGLQSLQCEYKDRACKQIAKSHGFCVVWNLLFLQMKLKHPDKNAGEIETFIMRSLEEDPKKLYKYIKNYSQFILENVERLRDEINIEKYIESHSTSPRALRALRRKL